MATRTIEHFAGVSLNEQALALRASFDDWLEKRRVYRKTLNELNNLTTRDLDDLGLRRTEITSIARKAAYGA